MMQTTRPMNEISCVYVCEKLISFETVHIAQTVTHHKYTMLMLTSLEKDAELLIKLVTLIGLLLSKK